MLPAARPEETPPRRRHQERRFEFATRGGLTIGLFDIEMPKDKAESLAKADESVAEIDRQFQRGLITEDERYEQGRRRLAGNHRQDVRRDDGLDPEEFRSR